MTSRYFELLCQFTSRADGTIKLGRAQDGTWSIHVIVPPGSHDANWRALASTFPEIAELDEQAEHLLGWVRAFAAERD